MNILLVRPDGIGDEILSLPVATELRRLMPGARLSLLSTDYAAPVLAYHPDLDEVLTVTGRETLSKLVRLFRRNVDAAIFLKPFRRLMTAAWLARVPLRVGTGYRWYSWLLNRRVYEHRRDFSRHESVYNLGLLRGLRLSPGDVSPPRLVVTDEERDWARRLLDGSRMLRVLVHPGGFSSRLWKPVHYRDLIWHLANKGREVLVTGTVAERDKFRTDTQISAWPAGVRDLMGQLTLRQLMAVIAESHAVVSLATGPMHMAAALGVPTVSIFDPRRSNSPTRWQPLGTGVVLRPEVPTCEKCIYEACPYWDCLDRITMTIVAERITQVLARSLPVQVADV
ncbi:MAG TPA: glycosyltransferase family 9 protein [Nitrospirales bacterium]|jgi:heptosyltransferase-2|nr:glycosyltransferase family 9 protein [Nitrospirales bacterium]